MLVSIRSCARDVVRRMSVERGGYIKNMAPVDGGAEERLLRLIWLHDVVVVALGIPGGKNYTSDYRNWCRTTANSLSLD
jgi:hypothetical protein